jgi:hypothetical protein
MLMFHSRHGAVRAALTLIMTAALTGAASAQLTRGSIAGTVRDASDAIVPGATVTVVNVKTNATQTVFTDSATGFYRAGALEPGEYVVRVELAGFTTVEQRAVQVRAATETPVDIRLDPAGIGETVQVTSEIPSATLNRSSPTIASTISARAIENLPLPPSGAAGRDINSLILTLPNSVSTTGQGTYAVNGNRPRNNNYMVDGSDNNDMSVTISTSQIVPEAIAEFQVMANPYSVEFGRNSGGQVNVITKSGSNRFAGDLFDYYRASGLNSRTNIEKANNLDTPPKLIRHQLGGDLGGPIVRDRLFFFGLYQRDSQRPAQRPSPTTVTIPTQAGFAALQGVPLGAGQSAASRQTVLQQVGFLQDVYAQNPVFRNVSNVLVNGVPIETGQTNLPIIDPSMYHAYFGRSDYRPWSSDTFTVRYSLNDRADDGIASTGFGPRFMANQALKDTNLALSNAHIFSPRMLNEFRFSLVRRDLDFPENDPNSPTATITGLFTLGGAANFPQGRLTSAYQFSNTTTWNVSRHTMKFGADIRYNDVDNRAAFNSKGSFTFNNLQDYMNNDPFQVLQALQTASWTAQQWQTYLFVQDDFRVTSDLTLNLGLRYEVSGVPLGMFGATDPESLSVGAQGPVRRDNNNWAPRAGFAWSPRTTNRILGDGQSVLRGGYGMAYDVLFYNLLVVNASNYPRVVTLSCFQNEPTCPIRDVYPNRLQGSATPIFNPLATWVNSSERTGNPESRFYSLSWQREFGIHLLEIGYSGSRGYKGINQIELNPAILTEAQAATVRAGGAIPSLQARRMNPAWGGRVIIPEYVGPGGNDVEARSAYNAMYVSLNRRITRGLMGNVSYTWSRWMSNNDASLGEGGTAQSSQRPQSMFDYEAEWSRSQYDRPHRLTVSYLWEIPGPRTGILGQVLGGWQFSGVTGGQSGQPFTIFTGVDSSGDGNTGSDRPNIDSSGSFVWGPGKKTFTNNGYYVVPLGANNLPLANSLGNGNAPRNSERGAAFWNTDLSLMKRFQLVGNSQFMVRIEAFNAFNQDNYGAPVSNMNSANFGINTNNFGRRIIQLGGKISF